ncbi:MAG: prepilin-type N-terminal cleavage/methylation domain-containing protein [Phycisphaeraceae bacterium]|nr:prepilin-type N-terminal cleavage/methylation domain-containing protein [Phycisphaeraceae bacterium]
MACQIHARVRGRRPRRAAFTLVEVLLALVLIGILVSSSAAFFWQLLHKRDAMIRAIGFDAACSSLMGNVERAVATASAARGGMTFQGDESSVLIPCRVAVPGDLVGAESFEVRFDAASRRVEVRIGEGPWSVLVEGVARVQWRYWDGIAWNDSFDAAAAGRLPGAIELRLWRARSEAAAAEPELEVSGDAERWRVFAVPDAREPSAVLRGGEV